MLHPLQRGRQSCAKARGRLFPQTFVAELARVPPQTRTGPMSLYMYINNAAGRDPSSTCATTPKFHRKTSRRRNTQPISRSHFYFYVVVMWDINPRTAELELGSAVRASDRGWYHSLAPRAGNQQHRAAHGFLFYTRARWERLGFLPAFGFRSDPAIGTSLAVNSKSTP